MNRTKVCMGAFVLFAVASATVTAQEAASAGGGEGAEIKVTAKRYEFSPNVITVKKGEHVKLIITALDRDHGFKLEALTRKDIVIKSDSSVHQERFEIF